MESLSLWILVLAVSRLACTQMVPCGDIKIDERYSMCCQGHVYIRYGLRPSCCGMRAYDAHTHLCCGEYVWPKMGRNPRCCDTQVYDDYLQECKDGKLLMRDYNGYNTIQGGYPGLHHGGHTPKSDVQYINRNGEDRGNDYNRDKINQDRNVGSQEANSRNSVNQIEGGADNRVTDGRKIAYPDFDMGISTEFPQYPDVNPGYGDYYVYPDPETGEETDIESQPRRPIVDKWYNSREVDNGEDGWYDNGDEGQPIFQTFPPYITFPDESGTRQSYPSLIPVRATDMPEQVSSGAPTSSYPEPTVVSSTENPSTTRQSIPEDTTTATPHRYAATTTPLHRRTRSDMDQTGIQTEETLKQIFPVEDSVSERVTTWRRFVAGQASTATPPKDAVPVLVPVKPSPTQRQKPGATIQGKEHSSPTPFPTTLTKRAKPSAVPKRYPFPQPTQTRRTYPPFLSPESETSISGSHGRTSPHHRDSCCDETGLDLYECCLKTLNNSVNAVLPQCCSGFTVKVCCWTGDNDYTCCSREDNCCHPEKLVDELKRNHPSDWLSHRTLPVNRRRSHDNHPDNRTPVRNYQTAGETGTPPNNLPAIQPRRALPGERNVQQNGPQVRTMTKSCCRKVYRPSCCATFTLRSYCCTRQTQMPTRPPIPGLPRRVVTTESTTETTSRPTTPTITQGLPMVTWRVPSLVVRPFVQPTVGVNSRQCCLVVTRRPACCVTIKVRPYCCYREHVMSTQRHLVVVTRRPQWRQTVAARETVTAPSVRQERNCTCRITSTCCISRIAPRRCCVRNDQPKVGLAKVGNESRGSCCHSRDPSTCCWVLYVQTSRMPLCCNMYKRTKSGAVQPQCSGDAYHPSRQMCCQGNKQPKRGVRPRCCGKTGFDAFRFYCCAGRVSRAC